MRHRFNLITHPPFLYRPGLLCVNIKSNPRCAITTISLPTPPSTGPGIHNAHHARTSSPTPGTPSPQPYSFLTPHSSTGPGIHDAHCARTHQARLQVCLHPNLIHYSTPVPLQARASMTPTVHGHQADSRYAFASTSLPTPHSSQARASTMPTVHGHQV